MKLVGRFFFLLFRRTIAASYEHTERARDFVQVPRYIYLEREREKERERERAKEVGGWREVEGE